MAVTYDNSCKQTVGGTSTVVAVCNMTIAAGAVLLVGVNTGDDVSVSAVYANGTLLTQLGRVVLSNTVTVTACLWGLTSSPSGGVSISAVAVGGVATTFEIMAASYLGAATTNPFGTVITTTATSVANVVMSVSTSTTHRVVLFGTGRQTFTAMNATVRQTDASHNTTFWADTAGPGNAISLSVSCNAVTQFTGFIAVNIAALVASTSLPPNKMALLGVGV